METVMKVFAAIMMVVLVWMLYRFVKQDGGRTLNKENTSKSLSVLGILAIVLIVVVGFAVMALRAS
ncbi:MAG: hypothetical protein RLZ35_197 [Pseudomonadota bacterium]|jgi:uncharacterized membrane protein